MDYVGDLSEARQLQCSSWIHADMLSEAQKINDPENSFCRNIPGMKWSVPHCPVYNGTGYNLMTCSPPYCGK